MRLTINSECDKFCSDEWIEHFKKTFGKTPDVLETHREDDGVKQAVTQYVFDTRKVFFAGLPSEISEEAKIYAYRTLFLDEIRKQKRNLASAAKISRQLKAATG